MKNCVRTDIRKEAVEQAIAYVKSYHYIDDLRYACSYVRYQKEKKSNRRLQQDLTEERGCKRVHRTGTFRRGAMKMRQMQIAKIA